MRASLPTLLLLTVALAAACSRTPAEPAPAKTSAASSTLTTASGTATTEAPAAAPSPTAPTSAAKCVHPLATVAPPIPPAAGAACPVDPEMGGPKLPVVDVSFPEASGAPGVKAELARTPHDIERGLMYRKAMADDHGMLFRLDGRRIHTFWMHNTCIPLDIMFVDDDGTVVGVAEAAPTLDDDVRSVPCPSSWVLEVNAGWTRKHGVKPGQKMTIPASAR